MAKAMASDAATLAARTALQVHGAIGYTWEHDLHLWMKRAWALAAAWGDAATHRARVLETLAGPAPLTAAACRVSAQVPGAQLAVDGLGVEVDALAHDPLAPGLELEQRHHGAAEGAARGLLPDERAQVRAEQVELDHHGVVAR